MEAIIAGLAAACQEGNPLSPNPMTDFPRIGKSGKSVMGFGEIPAEIAREARGRLRITSGIAGMTSLLM